MIVEFSVFAFALFLLLSSSIGFRVSAPLSFLPKNGQKRCVFFAFEDEREIEKDGEQARLQSIVEIFQFRSSLPRQFVLMPLFKKKLSKNHTQVHRKCAQRRSWQCSLSPSCRVGRRRS